MADQTLLHDFVNEELLEMYVRVVGLFYCHTMPILKTLGKCENLVFVTMSIREMYNLSVELWASRLGNVV